jgi:hypothetical protein
VCLHDIIDVPLHGYCTRANSRTPRHPCLQVQLPSMAAAQSAPVAPPSPLTSAEREEIDKFASTISRYVQDGNQVVFFLGAGASFTANVPMAGRLMKSWRQDGAVGDSYSAMVKSRFLGRPARNKYFRELCGRPEVAASPGHYALVRMRKAHRGLFPAVITTNFDPLIEKTLSGDKVSVTKVAAHEDSNHKTLTTALEYPDEMFSVVKVHGDPWEETYNTFDEVDTLPLTLTPPLFNLFLRKPTLLVFMGYSGSDAGVVQWLDAVGVTKDCVLYCNSTETSGPLGVWLRSKNFVHIKFTRFDELMDALGTCAQLPRAHSPHTVLDAQLMACSELTCCHLLARSPPTQPHASNCLRRHQRDGHLVK